MSSVIETMAGGRNGIYGAREGTLSAGCNPLGIPIGSCWPGGNMNGFAMLANVPGN